MPNKVTLCENVIEPDSWQTYDCADVREFLSAHYAKWPETAHIYLNYVAESADVTPYDEAGVNRLGELSGHFYVVILPEGLELLFIIIAIAVAAVSIGLSFLLRPHTNTANQQQTSPNNDLVNRDNTARPKERIPDIYGTVRSIPDLLMQSYRVFESISGAQTEVEYAYYCIGRGYYTVSDVIDDTTPLEQIDGSSAEVYSPYTSPNSYGVVPQLRVGTAIGKPVRNLFPTTAVNGQVLIAPNLTGGGNWVGPFIFPLAEIEEVWANFVAQSGCYEIHSTDGSQTSLTVTLEIGITPVNSAYIATGPEVLTQVNLVGSATLKNAIGVTLQVGFPASAVSVRAHRTSNTDIRADYSVSDEVIFRDCYAVSSVGTSNFGNVTTVQTRSLPTPQATGLQRRNLNLLVTRNLPAFDGTSFSDELFPTVSAADILCAMALDPRIGNRDISELDLTGIYATMTAITSYFGTDLCTNFCYTFADAQVSFEEMVSDVAASVFCIAYRRGSVITLSFEKSTDNSTLLFNHRNKLPKSETRTVSFGTINDNDGIELEYVDPAAANFPNADTPTTLYYPMDQSARNPKQIKTVGIRNNVQAWLLGWRLYNKLLYQNTVTEFDCTEEATTCVLQDRVLVADNTRSDTQDGEVIAQASLLLTLSQDVDFIVGRDYTIFLQSYDGTIDAINITAGSAPNQVLLAAPPTNPCVVDIEDFARTTYLITHN